MSSSFVGRLSVQCGLLDLRFASGDEERLFVAGRQAPGMAQLITLIALAMGGLLLQTIAILVPEIVRADAPLDFASGDARLLPLVASAQCVLVCAVLLPASRWRQLPAWATHEHAWIGFAAYWMTTACLARTCNADGVSQMASNSWVHDPIVGEIVVAIDLQCIVLMLGGCSLVRAHVSAALMAVAPTLYLATALSLGTPHADAVVWLAVALTISAALSASAGWRHERLERKLWTLEHRKSYARYHLALTRSGSSRSSSSAGSGLARRELEAFGQGAAARAPTARAEPGAAACEEAIPHEGDRPCVAGAEPERGPGPSEWFSEVSFEQISELGHQEKWYISPDELQVTMPPRLLGHGGFGAVVAASFHGRAVAVKIPRCGKEGALLRDLASELCVLRHVRHQNIVLFHGAVVDAVQGDLALVYELVRGLKLGAYIVQRDAPGPLDRFCLTFDICCALRYLHNQSPAIVHGDLKDGNVMVEAVSRRPRAKLIDFGLARYFTPQARSARGTTRWRAPELARRENPSPAPSADVFSLGWLTYFNITGRQPYDGMHGEALHAAMQGMEQRPRVALVLPPEAPFRGQAQLLCQSCLSYEAHLRPGIDAVHEKLSGWLNVGQVCQLGFDVAHARMPTAEWRDAINMLQQSELTQTPLGGPRRGRLAAAAPPWGSQLRSVVFGRGRACAEASREGQLPLPQVRVCIEAGDALRVLAVEPASVPELGALQTGVRFYECLQDAEHFRMWVCSTVNDIASGAAAAPMHADFGRVTLKRSKIGGPALNATLGVNFPIGCKQIGLRLSGWTDEPPRY